MSRRNSIVSLAECMKDTDNQEGWSDIRKQAFKQIDTNPNSYYYRFNRPGEDCANGPWSAEEDKLFMEQLKSMGANYRWGVFSKDIPGRVGYTVAQKYRKLLQRGLIWDVNHVWIGGTKFSSIRKGDCNNPDEFNHNNRYGFIVLHDETGVFKKTPCCHPEASKAFKKKFLKHKCIKDGSLNILNEPILMPKDMMSHVESFPDGAYGVAKEKKEKAPSKRKKPSAESMPKREYPEVTNMGYENKKWVPTFVFGDIVYNAGRFDTEKEAVAALDEAKLQIFGSSAKTHFPKKNYDLKQAAKKFETLRIKLGIQNALSRTSDLKLEVGDKNIFSSKSIVKPTKDSDSYEVSIVCNGCKEIVGYTKSKPEGEEIITKWINQRGPKIIEVFKKLREKSIEEFKKSGNGKAYCIMLYAHGSISVSQLLKTSGIKEQCKNNIPNFDKLLSNNNIQESSLIVDDFKSETKSSKSLNSTKSLSMDSEVMGEDHKEAIM